MADTKKRGETVEPKKSGATKAQSEMDRFRARRLSAAASTPASADAQLAGPAQWTYVAPLGGATYGWPWPPSFVPMGLPSQGGLTGYPAPGTLGLQGAPEGVAGRLGSTLGLGVDVVNSLLVGSIGLLQRLSAGYGYAPQAHGSGYGCGSTGGCGCGDPCLTECGYDCCCVLGCGTCCNPSVGSCC